MSEVRIAILAAGAAKRMGRAKQLAVFSGETLVARSVRVAQESGVGKVHVVLGCRSELIAPCLPPTVSVVLNSEWEEGIASSIRAAAAAASKESCDALLLMACDQPFVSAALLSAIASGYERSGAAVVASHYGTPGIPALFAREKFSLLLGLSGDRGAKGIIMKSDPLLIEAADAEFDIDTEEDFEELKECASRNMERDQVRRVTSGKQ